MTTTTTGAAATGIQAMQTVRGMLTQMIDTLSDEQFVHRACSGGNHALWIMGHMAFADDYFRTKLLGESPTMSEDWRALFENGSQPKDDAAAYPPIDQVCAAFENERKKLVALFESMDDDALNAASPEGWETFGPTKAHLPAFFAVHESMHVGQMTDIRRSLGMKPVMG